VLYLIIAAAVVLLDQLSKHLLTRFLAGGSAPLIPGLVRLVYVENSGAAFSMLSNQRWTLIAASSVAIVLILLALYAYREQVGRPACLALAFVLGGAVGNLIDRLLFGYVADFFEFEFVNFAVFNVADIFITLGGIAFLIFYLLHPGQKKEEIAAPEGETPEAKAGSDDAAD